jgi:hypothetical protein
VRRAGVGSLQRRYLYGPAGAANCSYMLGPYPVRVDTCRAMENMKLSGLRLSQLSYSANHRKMSTRLLCVLSFVNLQVRCRDGR